MKRALLPLMVSLAWLPACALAEPLPLDLTGPAYQLAREAYQAYDRKDYDQAIDKAREALRQRPDAVGLHDLVKLAQHDKERRDNPPRAAAAARPEPGYAEADQAFKAYERRDFATAARSARVALSKAPRRLDYHMLLIEALQRQDQWQDAELAAREALKVFPDDDDLLMRREAIGRKLATPLSTEGYQALQEGHPAQAAQKARQAVVWAPEMIANHYLLISALLADKDYPAAQKAATDALAQDNEDVMPWLLRSLALSRQGKPREVQNDLEQALKIRGLLNSEARDIHLFASDLALAERNPELALQHLARAEQLPNATREETDELSRRRHAAQAALRQKERGNARPGEYPKMALYCLQSPFGLSCDLRPGSQYDAGTELAMQAYAAIARKDFVSAESMAREAIARAPQNPQYHNLLVSALSEQKQLDKAVAAADEGLQANPDNARLYVQRGQLRQQQDDKAGAQEDFYQALSLGTLPAHEEASLYAAMGKPREARERLQQAREAGELDSLSTLQMAYLLVQSGDDEAAHAAFARADTEQGLNPVAVQDAAYNALRVNDDEGAVRGLKRTVDAVASGQLSIPDQQLFNTRRAIGDVSRSWGLTSSTSYRGASSTSGLSAAPGSSASSRQGIDSLQNSTELSWRPFGYRNARLIEVYGRFSDTLWSEGGLSDTGLDALQGTLGVRVKPFTTQNVIVALEHSFPLGSSEADSDWLVRLGYGSSIGTDLRVDTDSWWTSQLFAEAGRYLRNSHNYFNTEWQGGRSYTLGGAGSRWVGFPHVVAAFDYDSGMYSRSDANGKAESSSGRAAGLGLGHNVRYWFREDTYNAPRSYLDFSLQYRAKLFGDDRAKGVIARLTYSY